MRTFHVRRKMSKLSLDSAGEIESTFKSISKEVFGKKVTTYFKVFKSRCTCSFTIVLVDKQYDPQFVCIIVDNLANAVMQTYNRKTEEINECKRKARLYYALYMEKRMDKINKIKEEYAEIPID